MSNQKKDDEMTMQNCSNQHDDEVDLYKLFYVIWKAKLTILFFVVVSLMIGGGYVYFTATVYEVKIPYSVNASGLDVSLVFADVVDGGVIRSKKNNRRKGDIVLLISNLDGVANINEQVQQANIKITTETIRKAKNENDYLINVLPEVLRAKDI